jgi:hypothetical protein
LSKQVGFNDENIRVNKPVLVSAARIERIKSNVPITELLDKLGIAQGPRMKNGHPTYHCPFHDDSNPSLEISSDNRAWTCWPCQLMLKDAIALVQMIFFPQEQGARPKEWFEQTVTKIENLFDIESSENNIRAAAELRMIKNRQVMLSRQNRLLGRVTSRSNRFRLMLSRIVRKTWGDQLGEKAPIIVALYGHLEHLLASGQRASDSEQYKEWKDKVAVWIDNVQQRIYRR